MKKLNKQGFTLIELLVVVLIIGILAAIALPQYFKAVEKSRATEALSILGSLGAAMERARLVDSDSAYPATLSTLDIEFTNADGTAATGATITTKNFLITHSGVGVTGSASATRNSGTETAYEITRDYKTGQVTCTPGANTAGICESLGLSTATVAP